VLTIRSCSPAFRDLLFGLPSYLFFTRSSVFLFCCPFCRNDSSAPLTVHFSDSCFPLLPIVSRIEVLFSVILDLGPVLAFHAEENFCNYSSTSRAVQLTRRIAYPLLYHPTIFFTPRRGTLRPLLGPKLYTRQFANTLKGDSVRPYPPSPQWAAP